MILCLASSFGSPIPDSISSCNHTVSLLGMVTAGAGVALLPEVMVRGHLAKSELVLFAPELPMPELEFVVAWHGASDQHVMNQVVDLARQSSSFDRPAGSLLSLDIEPVT